MRRLSPRSPILAFLFAACTAPDSTMPTPAGQTPIGPTPTGAQTPDGTATDVHSCARPREVRVRHVALDLQLDFDQQLARGTATLDLDRMDPRAPLWLDTQGLAIAAVHTADSSRTPLRFELLAEDPLLGRPLRIELPGGLDRVAIDYATVPGTQSAMQWLAPAQTTSNAPFLFTQGQAILTRSWIPLQNSPGVRVT